jgi:hypothetical protein
MRVLLMTFLLAAAFAAVTYIETLGGLDQLPSLFSR